MPEMLKKADYNAMAAARKSAFQRIARELGKQHPITVMMGSLAWGRHKAEQGPDGTLHSAIREAAFLDGYFEALNTWARDNDGAAQRKMLEIYPRGFHRARPEDTNA